MSDVSKAELEAIMAKVAPNWLANEVPGGKTAGAFREYVTFVLMKMFIQNFDATDPSDPPRKISVNFQITNEGNDLIKLLCGSEGWEQNKFVEFDNS